MSKKKLGQIKSIDSPNEATLTDGTKIISKNINLVDDFYTSVMSQLSGNRIAKSGKSVLEGFVGQGLAGLKAAVIDPERCVTAMKYLGGLVSDTQTYYDSKIAGDKDYCRYLLQKGLFPWQRKVLECLAKKICLICGRRAGKTYALAKIAVDHCINGTQKIENEGVISEKPVQVIIIGLTITKCADLYWQNVKDAAEESTLPIAHIDNGEYKLDFANGASIQLAGVSSKAEIEKIRGADFSTAIIDESQSVKGLRNLVINILGPILAGRNGVLLMAGTAPLSAATYWEEIITSDDFTHFTATMEDNLSIPDYSHALEKVLEENHWTEDNVTFQREYLAKIVYDYDLIVYGRRSYRNKDEDLSEFNHCVIGCDWGWTDASALEAVIYNAQGEMREVLTWNKSYADVSEIVERAKAMVDTIEKEYHIPRNNIKMVADSSNGNVNAELYNKGLTMLENAYKFDKLYQIKILRENLASGDLLLTEGSDFDNEADKIVWKEDSETGRVIYEIDDQTFHGNSSDALRYAVNTIVTDLGLYEA